MRAQDKLRLRLRSLFFRSQVDRELETELRLHLDQLTEENVAGGMGPETIHFLEAVVYDREVMVKPEHARMVMEVYMAADLSAQRNEPVTLPLRRSLEKAA